MNKKPLTLGSLFDGSGAFPLGGILAEIEPVWNAEIEPFPVLVTHKRLPQVKHYGDVSAIKGSELEPVDIITFGSPCQDLSIAGRRAGIHDGERSSLFFQAIRIIREMREATNGEKPRYCVWENVPGAFSSNGGEDFRAVLEAVVGVKEEGVQMPAPENHRWPKADVLLGDGWSVAYRVLDAQYWGVPQRRSRIYLVGDFAGGSAGEILFKSEGMSGYTSAGFRSWQGAAGGTEEGAGEAGKWIDAGSGDGRYCLNPQGCSGITVTEEQTGTLVAQDHGHHPAVLQTVLNDQGGERMDITEDVTCTLRAQSKHPPCVMKAAGFSTEHSAQSRSIGYEEEMSPTLRAGVVPAAMAVENHPTDSRVKISKDGKVQALTERMGTGGGNVPLVAEREPITLKIRCGKPGGGKGPLLTHDKSATLGTNNDQTLFQPVEPQGFDRYNGKVTGDVTHTLDTGAGNTVPMVFQEDPKSYGIAKEAFSSGEKADFNFAINEELSPTLQARGPGAVAKPEPKAFGISSKTSKGMLSDNPKAGFYEAKTSRTLDQSGGNAVTSNQGGICIVAPMPDEKEHTYSLQGSMIGREEKNGPQGDGINEDVSFTLNTVDKHAVVAPAGDHYSASKGSFFTSPIKEQAGTLVATDWKDPPLVNDAPNAEPVYIVRRLTPVECARLQGFPDWWCSDLAIENPTDEELTYWAGVWETWRSLTNPDGKPKTEKQLRKWLAQPYTDASEYKLWGNGCCLPIVFFVLSGIKWAAEKEEA